MKLKILGGLLIQLLAILTLNAQTADSAAVIVKDETEIRRQSFFKVWNTINEKHFDPTFGGVDWKKMREIYEPKAMAAKSTDEFHGVLRQMLGELKLSHFEVYPPPPTAKSDDLSGGSTGITIDYVEGNPAIKSVEKNSNAEKAGVKTGFIIEKINGKSVAERLANLEKYMTAQKFDERKKLIYRRMVVSSSLSGKKDDDFNLGVLDGDNKSLSFNFKLSAANKQMSEPLGNFPAQEVIFESRRLDGNIGYIRFSIWLIPQMAKIRAAVREFADAKGIIFDLRGNPGGVGGIATGAAGLLVNEQISLGSMNGRDSELKFIVYPQPEPFAGKVMILTDYGSASTSEIFAASLQETGRAKVVGTRSAGLVLPSVFEILPTGAIFQYAISDYKSPNNILIEGRGVAPDFEVKQTRKALLEGRDLPLEKAIEQILNSGVKN
ncbi:MAG: S41 family peptidase [Pyrinomonadaceae bacterium]